MVEEIVVESNNLIKSVQVILDALNELRLCHVMERATSAPSKTEGSKVNADATDYTFNIYLGLWPMLLSCSRNKNCLNLVKD